MFVFAINYNLLAPTCVWTCHWQWWCVDCSRHPPASPALRLRVLGGQHIRIVSTNNVKWRRELTRYGMSEERVQVLRHQIMRAWDSLVMDDEMRCQGNVSTDEAWLVVHFLEHAHTAHASPPPPLNGNRHHTL